MTPSPDDRPRPRGILETALYVDDLARACRFYEVLLGLSLLHRDERLAAYEVAPAQVLLLFLRGSTSQTVRLPGGSIPPHEGAGRLHFAFAIDTESLPAWLAHLQLQGIEIEGRTDWPQGGHSLYFRDPDQHLVELATPGLWRNY